jgi:hypothetical protein
MILYEIFALIGLVNAFHIAIGTPDTNMNFDVDSILSKYSIFLINKTKNLSILKPLGFCFYCFGFWVGLIYFNTNLTAFGIYLFTLYIYGKIKQI